MYPTSRKITFFYVEQFIYVNTANGLNLKKCDLNGENINLHQEDEYMERENYYSIIKDAKYESNPL